MSARTTRSRRHLTRALATGISVTLIAAGAVVLGAATGAQAAVVKSFSQDYAGQVYGDFLEVGSSSVTCPDATTVDPTRDADGEPANTVATCTVAQQRGDTTYGDESYRMIWANPGTGILNSSQAALTIPPGASVAFARLNWSAPTGYLENADATGQVAFPSCGTGNTADDPAVLPDSDYGTYATNPVTLIANGQTATYAPGSSLQVDPVSSLGANAAQDYSAYADVTAQLAGATTGTAIPITVQNLWGPSGFSCYGGWSLTVVYSYPTPNATYAPFERQVYVYNGHDRQQMGDPTTSVSIGDLHLASNDTHLGVTAYGGDYNVSGDEMLINGTAAADPLTAGDSTPTTDNFFVGDAEGNGTFSNGAAGGTFTAGPPNVFSVDAKTVHTTLIAADGTAPSMATVGFTTSGDDFLAQEVVLSSVLPEIRVAVAATTTVARAGGTASYTVTVTNPTGSPLSDVAVTDSAVSDCDAPDIGALAGNATYTYTCSGTVPDDGSTSFTNDVSASGDDYTGSPVTATGSADPVIVIHPSIGVTATADKSLYTAGQPITYSVTVTNTGDATLTDTAVTDTTVASCAQTLGTLAAGAASTYTCGATAPVTGGSTTVMAVGTDPTGGTVDASANAPSPTAATVSGTVFADANDDGTIDGSDTGIPSVTLSLKPTSGPATTTTTGADGGFSFPTVAPGTYTLTETQPAGYAQGKDTPGTGATATAQDVETVTVGDDGASSGNLFGEVPSDSLAGVVYVDSDDNGVKAASEAGIEGVTIDLSGTDDGGNAVSATTQTLADGSYTFPALRPGTYTLKELQPQGYVQGKDAAGTPAGETATQDTISAVTLAGTSTTGTGYDFGELVAASLAGQVATAAGTALDGVTVTLTGTDDNGAAVSAQTTTGTTGAYAFTGLRPGSYAVESQPAAYLAGSATAGSKGGMAGADEVSVIPLASGDSATGYDFVETAGSLSGTVFSDPGNDGTQGGTDPGIGGVTVTLTGTGADGRVISASTPTRSGGTFSFTDLPAGTGYTVTETPPGGYLAGTTTAGTGGGTVSGDTVSGVTVQAGTAATGYTFAEVAPASVGGVITDQLGTPEAGVTVALGGAAAMSTTTASDGSYGFNDLYPGTYTLTEDQPTGLGDGTDTVGSVGGTPDGMATSVNSIGGIALSGGGLGTGYDFTDTSGSIAGRVFVDANGDGVFDSGDSGIGSVTVTATDGTQTLTARTGTDGTYSITGLPAGTWTITETPPTGYGAGVATVGSVNGTPSGTSPSSDTVTGVVVPAGGVATDYSFTQTTASISGTVFLDANGDGIQDGSEQGLSGVTITLKHGTAVVGTRSTTAQGSWSFTGLLAGTYTVVETQPAGYSSGPDTIGGAGGTDDGNGTSISAIPLAAGAAVSGYTFAEYVGSSLSGTVTDSAGNPLPGVTVTVSGGGLTTPVGANTGTDGSWSVPNLAPGSYTVTETQPAGYGNGTVTAGTDGGTPSTDGNSVTAVTVTSGSTGKGTGPAFVDAAATLSGSVFVDANGDGLQDGSEQGLGGVPLTLTNTTTGLSYTVTTANGTNGTLGSWTDAGLPAGTYTIAETRPAGYASGTDTPGTPANGSAASDGQTISGITVAAGSTNTGYTFAEYVSSTVTGTVKTDGGAALANVTITATDANGVSHTTTTGASGGYSLTLPPGTYALAESQPSGYGDGSATLGSGVGGSVTGPNGFGSLQVTSGSSGSGYSFTDTTSGLSGTVFADINNDGVQDGQEPGIAGVTVTVRTSGTGIGTVVGTSTTTADGAWSVSGLLAGSYTITETQPTGYGNGTATAGSAGGTPSADGNTITVSLPAGTPGTGYDFADTLGAISGTVFLDANDNGVEDPGDTPIAGVTVTLLSGTTVAGTATTATDGSWAVTGLVAGTYTLHETQPAGYANGTDTAGSGGGTLVPPDTFTGVTVVAGEDEDGYTFAETVGAITGVVALDNNGDGVYTPGIDRPEAGVTVTLYDGAGAIVATTSTAGDGTYAFTGLPPDNYTVVETQPSGYGSDTSNAQSLTLDGGGATEFFGDIGSTVGGTVWRDTNRDGVRDDGEPAVGRIVLVLRNGAGQTLAKTTSASNGSYAFTDLPAGTYTVTVGLPTGDVVTTEYRATTAQTGSTFSPVTATTAPIVITVDQTTGVISADLAADVGLATAYADITISASGPSAPVAVGTAATSTITVVNDGNETQPGATVTMIVPAGQAPTTVGGSTFTCSATPTTAAGTMTITCRTTTPIDPGASAPPITLITEPTGPGTTSIAVSVAAFVRARDASATNDHTTIPVAGIGAAIVAAGESDGTVNGALPYTGLDLGALIGLALMSMSAGLVLLVSGRRRVGIRERAGLPRRRPTRVRSRRDQALAAVRRAATSSQLMMFHSAET